MIWGVVVLEPTTTITNLILTVECWVLFRLCRPRGIPRPIPERWEPGARAPQAEGPSIPPGQSVQTDPDPARSWSGFFFFLGFATLLGAAKDGFPHYLGAVPLYLTVLGSSLASGLGVLHAEAAAIRKHARTHPARQRLRLLSLGKFTLLVVAIALHDSIGFVIANTALGLVPIMVAEYRTFRRGDRASGWIAGGIALSSLAAFAYLFEVPSYPWFDHRDLPHVLMMGTLVLIFRGLRRRLDPEDRRLPPDRRDTAGSDPNLHDPDPRPEALIRKIRRVTWAGLFGNLAMSGLKFILGVLGSSQALVADAVHSLSDLITDFAILIGVRFWASPPDEGHPYGHGRIESMVTVGIGTILALAAVGIGYGGFQTIRSGEVVQPGLIALFGALLSILVKEVLYRWTVHVGSQTGSTALVANAWHHRSDALSSIPVAIAILAATIRPEWAILDAVGAVVVAGFILRVAWKILHPSLAELSDGSAPPEVRLAIPDIAAKIVGIHDVHDIRTRQAGQKVFVDLHATVSGELSLKEAHQVGEELRKTILQEVPEVEAVMVHLDPGPPAS